MHYVYGTAVDELLARTDSGGNTDWYLTDRLGSVRDIVSTTGSVLDQIAYDSYGNVTSESSPSNGDRFKYAGMQYDSATGLYFDNARYYDPSGGRFLSQDPTGFGSGDVNLYRYTANSPTDLNDPTGMSAMSGGGTGGFVGQAGSPNSSTANSSAGASNNPSDNTGVGESSTSSLISYKNHRANELYEQWEELDQEKNKLMDRQTEIEGSILGFKVVRAFIELVIESLTDAKDAKSQANVKKLDQMAQQLKGVIDGLQKAVDDLQKQIDNISSQQNRIARQIMALYLPIWT